MDRVRVGADAWMEVHYVSTLKHAMHIDGIGTKGVKWDPHRDKLHVPMRVCVQGHSLSIWAGMGGAAAEMSPASDWATTAAPSCPSKWASMLVLSRMFAWGQQLELQLPPDSVEPESNGIAVGATSEDWET